MWFDESVFYHIYPFGLCGTEAVNDFSLPPCRRFPKLIDWLEHMDRLGVNALYIGPVFQSSTHGYDTKDYHHIDRRLGTDDDFKDFVAQAHHKGIKVVVDGVFNHVGRNFFAFEDVLTKKEKSPYCSWFKLDFSQSNHFGDGFCYYGWDGCDDLVKLDLRNREVKDYLFTAIEGWIDRFDIDGIRLDTAHYLHKGFLKELGTRCRHKKADFWLMGEVVFGNYRHWCSPERLNSVTNYECYKGFYSSFNSYNMYEITHSLERQFGAENGIYKGLNLYSFLENHDVSRIASILKNPAQLKAIYTLMFTIPGIPSIYYGGEWGLEGWREISDSQVRPCLDLQADTDLTLHLKYLIDRRKNSPTLAYGDYKTIELTSDFLLFSRSYQGNTVYVAINIGGDEKNFSIHGQNFKLYPFSSEIYFF